MKAQKISENQRLQYLQALGIEAWISRDGVVGFVAETAGFQRAESAPCGDPDLPIAERSPSTQDFRYEIGPGSGQTLLLCASREQAASPLASDIARCLDEAPVWGWQVHPARQEGASQAGLSLNAAIADHLFTRVLLFCSRSANLFGPAQVIGSARVIHAPDVPELANHPQQKRALWMQLVQHGWCVGRS